MIHYFIITFWREDLLSSFFHHLRNLSFVYFYKTLVGDHLDALLAASTVKIQMISENINDAEIAFPAGNSWGKEH